MWKKLSLLCHLKQKSRIVGLDVGLSSVKLVEIKSTFHRPELTAMAIAEWPEPILDEGELWQEERLLSGISRALHTAGTDCRDVIAAISGQNVFVRELVFPLMTQDELAEAIKWETDKYVPFEPGTYFFDFALLPDASLKGQIRVFLAAAPKNMILPLVNAAEKLGINLIAAEIAPLAAIRALYLPDETNAVLLEVGASATRVAIFYHGAPVILRSIPIGGQHFTQTIMETLGLNFGETETLKRRQNALLYPPDAEVDVSNVLHAQLMRLVDRLGREVRRTIEYYQMQNRDRVLEHVYVTGGGIRLENLRQHLASQLGTELLMPNFLEELNLPSRYELSYLQNSAAQLTNAIGAALEGAVSEW